MPASLIRHFIRSRREEKNSYKKASHSIYKPTNANFIKSPIKFFSSYDENISVIAY